MASRFGSWPAWPARIVLVLVLCLSIYGAWSLRPVPVEPKPASAKVDPPNEGDPGLYRAIVNRMGKGEGYYEAAAAEQRARDYPLKPFVTMRPPTMALMMNALGGVEATAIWFKGLAFLALGLFAWALRRDHESKAMFAVSAVAAGLSLAILLSPGMQLWHEGWAALLVMCSLALHRLGYLWPAILAAIFATLIRELIAPFLLVMAFCALLERKKGEVFAWGAALIPLVVLMFIHARMVTEIILPGDMTSPGWARRMGWPIVAEMAATGTFLVVFGKMLGGGLTPFALLGWAGRQSALGLRIALLLGGMAVAFMLFARHDNIYWMLMLSPLLPLGLVYAPSALRDLAQTGLAGGK